MIPPKIVVRRARRRDLPTIVGIMNSSGYLGRPITEAEALERLHRKGVWLAISRTGAALVGWQTENLVTCLDEFYVYPPYDAPRLGPPLLASVESAAKELESEIAAVIIPERAHPNVAVMLVQSGYHLTSLKELDPIWREVLEGLVHQKQQALWIKPLRADRVVIPI